MKKIFTLITYWLLIASASVFSLPKLSSLTSAQATMFLDFDGQSVIATSWNSGNPLMCAPSGLSDNQITEIFNRVSEDYRPFNINITTDSAEFLAAPINLRVRIIITPTSSWYTGVGGVSYTGSFTWGDDTPGFVFPDRLGPYNTKMIAECCSHEGGHTIGLSHQSRYDNNCVLTETYNDGFGTGEISWAPVMGNSYYKNLSGWSNGPTPYGCTSAQDNLAIITSNGFGYRPDDHSDDVNNNPTLINISNQSFSADGIITTTTDKDAFKLNLSQSGAFHLSALPFSVGANDEGADIDLKVTLLNEQRQTIKVYNPPTLLNVTIDTSLISGIYYLLVDGTGNSNTSDYGSLGSYRLEGTFSAFGVTPINAVILKGHVNNNKHNLSWNIISDEQIKTLSLESSGDGRIFTSLTTFNNVAKNFTYDPFSNANKFYRLKATSVTGQVVYSNVIVLKSINNSEKLFTVSTIVHDQVLINASENYQYYLADVSGRIISKGANSAGVQQININNNPNGIYIIQLISNSQRQTERIIKQ